MPLRPPSIVSRASRFTTATHLRPGTGFLPSSCRLQRPLLPQLVGKTPPRLHLQTALQLRFQTTRASVSNPASSIPPARIPDEMGKVDTSARLSALRTLMVDSSVDVYIVPSEDSHSSEYIAPCDARRAFISGFTGSAGCAVVTPDKAALATDGRYFNQASQQLDDNWHLLKQGTQGVLTWQEWAAEQSAGGKSVGVDPTLLTGTTAKNLDEKIKKSGGKGLVPVDGNLVDKIWGADRPARPNEPIILLGDELAGKSLKDKLTDLRKEIEKKESRGFVVSMLDEVAWLFNLRGNDIPFNPVFFSYAIVTQEEATLYIDPSKLSADCQSYLASNSVTIKDYNELLADAQAYGVLAKAPTEESGSAAKFLISTKTSWALKMALGGPEFTEDIRSPVGDAKAVKNETELKGMRDCHVRDGAALIEYFAWLEHQLIQEQAQVDEVQAADKLEELRSKQKDYVGLSFPTISSTGPNAAVIHYKPEAGSCSVIDPKAVYLCDSGAQFRDGTTDVTRTLHFGTPTAAEIEAYTLVLKGNISLDTAIFPKGTTGYAIDCLARQHLWQYGLDYRHGTGHGIGSYLNVHEGPMGIGTRVAYAEVPLATGHVLSNEPGFYEDGSFGIRIENVMMAREVKPKHSFGDKPWLGFEHVTMAPYCRKLIDVSLLTDAEKTWVNEYHADIWEKTKGYFESDKLTLGWLERETQPL